MKAIVPTSTMMDFYLGGGIDYAFLGVGEAGCDWFSSIPKCFSWKDRIWFHKEWLKRKEKPARIWLIHASAIV